MRWLQELAGGAARGVEIGDRHRLLVSRHLKDAVRRRVDDPVAGAALGVTQLIEDRGTRGGLIPQHTSAGAAGKFVYDICREAVGISRKRLIQYEAAQFPMPGGAVFPRGTRLHDAPGPGRRRCRVHAVNRFDPSEAERFQTWQVESAEEYVPDGRALYRFFELFDWEAIPAARKLADAAAAGEISLSPPFKPHLEDKLWLALLWSPALKPVWRQALRHNHLDRLRELVPFGWVLDPAPLPPHAALPKLDAHSWDEVAAFSQKERQLVLKISGFHESAWGSRGVFIGHDLPAAEWRERLGAALAEADEQPWLLQEFREARLVEHPVFRDDGGIELMRGRVRLCPYFFTDDAGETTFAGCLATIVPADKKKIHGMSDGVLVPCVIG